MSDATDYRELFLRAEEGGRETTEGAQPTTFKNSFNSATTRPSRAQTPSQCSEKCCPLRFEPWTDCLTKQQNIYNSVCSCPQLLGRNAPQSFFCSRIGLSAVRRVSKAMRDSCGGPCPCHHLRTMQDEFSWVLPTLLMRSKGTDNPEYPGQVTVTIHVSASNLCIAISGI